MIGVLFVRKSGDWVIRPMRTDLARIKQRALYGPLKLLEWIGQQLREVRMPPPEEQPSMGAKRVLVMVVSNGRWRICKDRKATRDSGICLWARRDWATPMAERFRQYGILQWPEELEEAEDTVSPETKWESRICLRCGCKFPSYGRQNRMCLQCAGNVNSEQEDYSCCLKNIQ